MICIGKIDAKPMNTVQKNHLQQQYRKQSILSVGCTSELFGQNAKWRAIAFHQALQMPFYIAIKWFLGFRRT